MSFLGPSQRGYDPLVQPQLSHLQRLPMNGLSAYDNLPAPPMHPALQTPMPPAPAHGPQHPAHYLDRSPIVLPKVGETRCYWVLLTSELNFVYLDPVLASHLQEQADLLIGKSLLAFVHPDEQASAEQDLGGVLDSRTLHGSVTRVRYSRLSRVRRQLGYQGPGPSWQDADKIAVDANYVAVDIVINWAADGVVLCFIHAVVDLSPRDNDEHNKTGWTNWCGTPYMTIQQVDFLYKQLRQRVPQPPSRDRVFQILLNQPDRPLWFSWPEVEPIRGPTSKDFARLASEVNINNNPGGTDAKTSCTRRFKALQRMEQFEGSPEVESIFIPYGSIIFACHKVNSSGSKNGNTYANNANTQYYDHGTYSLPPVPGPASYTGSDYGQPHTSSSYASQSWSSAPESNSYHQWSQTAPIASSPSISSMRSSSYGPTSQSAPQQHQWPSQAPAFMDSSPTSYSFPQGSAPYGQAPPNPPPSTAPAASPADDVVPASRNTHRRGSAANREQYGNGGRGSGNPPIGIMQCISCKVTQSPEWRKGPSGKKDLCNACGLRYARSRAKKEGGTQRRRKDKVLSSVSSRSDHSPSTSPVNMPYNTMRRGSVYDDSTPFTANASLPPAGNDVFTSQAAGLHGMTPSPSPPSAPGGGFLPYAPHALESQNSTSSDQRGHAHFAPQYYSIPPPMPGTQHGLHGGGHPSTTLPRLEPMMPPFASRMSPAMHSPTTPLATSPMGSHYSAASYEREKRDKERDRGVPLSAEQRKY